MEQISVMKDSFIMFIVYCFWFSVKNMKPRTSNFKQLLPQIQKHNCQGNDSPKEINGITLHFTRLYAFYKTGNGCCCIRYSIHQAIHNILIDPRCRATNEIKNYFLSDEKIYFINIKFLV